MIGTRSSSEQDTSSCSLQQKPEWRSGRQCVISNCFFKKKRVQLCKLVLCVDGHGEGATHACRRVRVSGTLAWRTIAPVSLGSSLKEESQLTYTPEYVFKSPSLFFLGAHSNAEITQSIDNRIRAWYEMTNWLKLMRTAVPSILRCLICIQIY